MAPSTSPAVLVAFQFQEEADCPSVTPIGTRQLDSCAVLRLPPCEEKVLGFGVMHCALEHRRFTRNVQYSETRRLRQTQYRIGAGKISRFVAHQRLLGQYSSTISRSSGHSQDLPFGQE